MQIKYNIRQIRKQVRTLAVGLLLLAYIAGHVELGAIHSELHGNDTHGHVSHTFADEQDPCHVSIYHNSAEPACDHKAHLTTEKKCPLCHLYSGTDKLVSEHTLTSTIAVTTEASSWYASLTPIGRVIWTPSRAPPAAA